jgi:formylglycine-generating enzyme required for sulfatase activity
MNSDKRVSATFTIPLGAAVDSTGIWTNGPGAGAWYGQSAVTHDGTDAAQSGDTRDNSNSWMQTTVTGPGKVSFWWKVSSERYCGCDHLKFYVGATQRASISGEVDWVQVPNIDVPAGNQTLTWQYTKDDAVTEGSDAGWVDQVVFVQHDPLTITKAGTGSGTVTADPGILEWSGNTSTAYYYDPDTPVTLTAQEAADSSFEGWSGACTGTSRTCTVTMSEARTVTARFVLLPGLVQAHWSFDASDATDDSGSGHDGVVHGAPAFVRTSVNGTALSLVNPGSSSGDPGTDYVTVPHDEVLNFTEALTIASWVKIADADVHGTATFVAKSYGHDVNQGYAFGLFEGTRLAFEIGPGNGQVEQIATDDLGLEEGHWYRVAVTFDHRRAQDNVVIYLDGVPVKTHTTASVIAPWDGDLYLGGMEAEPYDRHFEGTLDDVRLYGHALTPSQVAELDDHRIVADDFMELVLVPAGTFIMGDEFGDGETREGPAHPVTISRGFYLGKYEVAQRQWQEIMGSNPSYFSACGVDCPVERVSWDDIQDFITALNAQTGQTYRLPTEAEWEYAAKGGPSPDGTKYAGSDTVDDVAWYLGTSLSTTHPVGQKQPNGSGLYDMSGNVWEWVEDSWHYDYDGAPADGSAWLSGDSRRVIRGSSWVSRAWDIRVSYRTGHYSSDWLDFIGFRLAQDLE